ncbi:MAG: Maf family protein [Steroidobacteraceae bacterium]
MTDTVLTLASGSPRRSELLTQIGIAHRVLVPDVDESRLPDEPPRDYVLRVARVKAFAVRTGDASLPVLAADTAVALGEEILGKPRDREGGIEMLQRLSGRSHKVFTGVALAWQGETPRCVLSESQVTMRAITRAEAEAYWESGEPRDKAGAYGIQGRGAVFVAHLSGSFSGVMGLPLFEVAQLLRGVMTGVKG